MRLHRCTARWLEDWLTGCGQGSPRQQSVQTERGYRLPGTSICRARRWIRVEVWV